MSSRSRGASTVGPTRKAPPGRDEQRYIRGERRTCAEPLAASWNPDLDESEQRAIQEKPRRSRRVSKLFFAYGWRVYAIPVLVVVTVLIMVNATQRGDDADVLGPDGAPIATEGNAVPVNANSGTAVLPAGGTFPESGAGSWHVVPGSGPVVGTGPHVYHYQVAVEDGIDPAAYGGDDAFAHDVDAVLDDSRSWIAAGTISLQRVDASYANPDFVVSLTTPNTDHRPDLCGFQIPYEASCWRPSAHRVIINLARWVRGALAFNGDLGLYRQYAINHEVGHVFGNQHVGCNVNGGLAPVMMQQTFGVSDNYVWQLNQVDPSNKTKVPQDGKVCKPNAWPYPQGPNNPADSPPS